MRAKNRTRALIALALPFAAQCFAPHSAPRHAVGSPAVLQRGAALRAKRDLDSELPSAPVANGASTAIAALLVAAQLHLGAPAFAVDFEPVLPAEISASTVYLSADVKSAPATTVKSAKAAASTPTSTKVVKAPAKPLTKKQKEAAKKQAESKRKAELAAKKKAAKANAAAKVKMAKAETAA